MQGMESPFDEVIEENRQMSRAPPTVRVEKMFEAIKAKLPGAPKFLVCILPERKNCDIYGQSQRSSDDNRVLSLVIILPCHVFLTFKLVHAGPWKRKCLSDFGIFTQCLAPTKVNDQYLTNLLLKINAKVS